MYGIQFLGNRKFEKRIRELVEDSFRCFANKIGVPNVQDFETSFYLY